LGERLLQVQDMWRSMPNELSPMARQCWHSPYLGVETK
jgi:hypothetical protein